MDALAGSQPVTSSAGTNKFTPGPRANSIRTQFAVLNLTVDFRKSIRVIRPRAGDAGRCQPSTTQAAAAARRIRAHRRASSRERTAVDAQLTLFICAINFTRLTSTGVGRRPTASGRGQQQHQKAPPPHPPLVTSRICVWPRGPQPLPS